jgi:glucose dehydrogenase
MKKTLSKTSMRAIALSLLFIISGIGASLLINPAGAIPNPAAPAPAAAAAAPAPLTQAEANWAASNGNSLNQDYNPQTQINSSDVQDLGLDWLFPLPGLPPALTGYAGFAGGGVDTAPLIINGTVYATDQDNQVFALNAGNGDVEWTDDLPVTLNSTAGLGVGSLSLHLHDNAQSFTTSLFNNTPTYWIAASNYYVYAIDALNGQYEVNFSIFMGASTIPGNHPGALYNPAGPAGILVDQSKGVLISSVGSGEDSNTGRCFFRGWNVTTTPPQLMWTTYCTPPQPGGSLPVDPNWDISQVDNMSNAEIFYPGPSYDGGGMIPGTAVVNLKNLTSSQLNSTLYNDWGYADQSSSCSAFTGGYSTGSTAAGWGAPWLAGTGPTAGMAFVTTNNRDPYNSPCIPGPGLWAASVLALNITTGAWMWGFQATPHDNWDWDCSWWQALGNETVNGAPTQVLFKTCKNGYLYEINAVTGNLIWAYTPPQNVLARCTLCYIYNPLNSTEMSWAFFNPTLKPTLMYPDEFAGIENEGAFDPALNLVFIATQNVPLEAEYVAPNSTNYATDPGTNYLAPGAAQSLTNAADNSTITAVNATTGKAVWTHFIPTEGYRGGLTSSGNVVYATLSSGDIQMINAQTGSLIRDYYIGGPLNVLAPIGATATGQEIIIVPITAGLVTWGTSVPGDLVALSLTTTPSAASTAVSTTTATVSGSTVTATVTASASAASSSSAASASSASVVTVTTVSSVTGASSGINSSAFYGVAVVAVIFIVATGYFAMRGRRPAATT